MAGGHGARVMRDQFAQYRIDVLDTFSELDEVLERFTRRFTIPG
ncbi:MAG: hypothetical protein AABZ34_11725 [Nitrospirota bacterium]